MPPNLPRGMAFQIYQAWLPLWNFLGNVAAGLIAYMWREKKPSLNIQLKERFLISN